MTKRFAKRRSWGETLRHLGPAPRVTVVDDVSFGVAAGEIFGLLGQNGAGKTTLFRMLATLLEPDAGSAHVDGFDVTTDQTAVRARIAPVLANERSLYWRLPAAENLRLYAILQGIRPAAVRAECERVLAAVDLADTGEKMVGSFSSGMRQRLLIARALLGRPRVLLLDEPTRSLDPISARDFRRFLRTSIVDGEGCTVLLATHDADDVWELCDRVAVLDNGRLLAVDESAALQRRVGGSVLEMSVASDDEARTRALLADAGLQVAAARDDETGWRALQIPTPDDINGNASLLRRLHAAEIRVGRFAPRPPALADLLERVVRQAGVSHA